MTMKNTEMTAKRTETAIDLCGMAAEEADRAGNHNHARILRRAGMQIDKCLPKE